VNPQDKDCQKSRNYLIGFRSQKTTTSSICKLAITPEIRNTDDEVIRFCKIFFVINVRHGLEERLSSIRSFDYDERNKMWTWVKRGNKVVRSFETTALGTVSIKRKYLVAETNSEERALRLTAKLKKALKEYVSFEKMDIVDLDSMPPID
jgi:hypothetical protein